MFGKCLSLLLSGLMLGGVNPQIATAQAPTAGADEKNRVEKIKTNVYRLEERGKTKLVVKLRSGAKLKGYITKLEENSFDLTNYKTRQTVAVAYGSVARVKPDKGFSKFAGYAFGGGIVTAIVTLFIVLPRRGPLGDFCPLGCRSF